MGQLGYCEQIGVRFLEETTSATNAHCDCSKRGFIDFSDFRTGKIISRYNTIWNMLPFALKLLPRSDSVSNRVIAPQAAASWNQSNSRASRAGYVV